MTDAAVGYVLGRLRREHDERAAEAVARAAYIRQIQEHERQIRANRALIGALTEDGQPTVEMRALRHHKVKNGWEIHG